jgi:thiol peroxidase
MERTGIFEIGGNGVTIVGPDIEVGQDAPEFIVQDQDWKMVNGLESSNGKVRILAAVPSLETGVCDTETRRFNEEASKLGEEIQILTISTDLPFTQKRWCGAAGVDKVQVLSDHMETDFGQKYGTLIKERRFLRRAVFVVNRDGKVTYVEYLPVLGEEPNYDAVLKAAQEALN